MDNEKKTLVAYFSCSGVTAKTAATLADIVGADLYEIAPEIAYTRADLVWTDKNSRSTIEMNDTASRPAIGTTVANMGDYDTVFIGFPIWWYIAPKIINTFLESYDFSGKTIIPFATSGSSKLGDSEQILKALCPDSVNWIPGKLLNRASKDNIAAWVNSLGL